MVGLVRKIEPSSIKVSGVTAGTGPEALPKVTMVPLGRSSRMLGSKVAAPTPS
jgi:hypothetical protein